jgi:hypothetical protein
LLGALYREVCSLPSKIFVGLLINLPQIDKNDQDNDDSEEEMLDRVVGAYDDHDDDELPEDD